MPVYDPVLSYSKYLPEIKNRIAKIKSTFGNNLRNVKLKDKKDYCEDILDLNLFYLLTKGDLKIEDNKVYLKFSKNNVFLNVTIDDNKIIFDQLLDYRYFETELKNIPFLSFFHGTYNWQKLNQSHFIFIENYQYVIFESTYFEIIKPDCCYLFYNDLDKDYKTFTELLEYGLLTLHKWSNETINIIYLKKNHNITIEHKDYCEVEKLEIFISKLIKQYGELEFNDLFISKLIKQYSELEFNDNIIRLIVDFNQVCTMDLVNLKVKYLEKYGDINNYL